MLRFSPLLHSVLVDRTILLLVGMHSETTRDVKLVDVDVTAADAVGHQEELVGIAPEQGEPGHRLRHVEEGRRGMGEAFLGAPRLARVATTQSPVASLGDFVSIVSQNQWLEKHEHQRLRSRGRKYTFAQNFPFTCFHSPISWQLIS